MCDIYEGLKKGILLNYPKIECKDFPKAVLNFETFDHDNIPRAPTFKLILFTDKKPKELYNVEVLEWGNKKLYKRELNMSL